EHSVAETPIVSIALDAALPNRAESSAGLHAGPNRSFMILEKPDNALPAKLRIPGELAVSPACKSFGCSNPELSVAGYEQAPNIVAGELLTGWWHPCVGLNSIEAEQAELRPQPEITIRRLGDCVDQAFEEAVADFPRRMSVLADLQSRVQRER